MQKQPRLYLIDITRAFAAICVVLQHYQHFYLLDTHKYEPNFIRSQQPFYNILESFYKFGSVAVQFFFVISGFIFFMYYRQKINQNIINFKNFFILRLTRLYPLHFLMLILMLFFQIIHLYLNGKYFVYEENNFKNFTLHLFLIQEWGFKNSGWSFNAPAWSISVELFCYISFFFISLVYIKNFIHTFILVVMIFIFYVLIKPNFGNLIIGILLFYVGGLTFYVYKFLKLKIIAKKNLYIILLIFFDFIIFGRFLNEIFLHWQISLENIIGNRLMLLLFFIKFPLILINLAILQIFFEKVGKKIQIFGDISYSIYLSHVPLQVLFSIFNHNIISINYNNNFIFILYFLSVFIFSAILYKFFELPSKNFLRNKLM
jgi:peptidoglycan/LPS O-acetylase OafA/YrhL